MNATVSVRTKITGLIANAGSDHCIKYFQSRRETTRSLGPRGFEWSRQACKRAFFHSPNGVLRGGYGFTRPRVIGYGSLKRNRSADVLFKIYALVNREHHAYRSQTRLITYIHILRSTSLTNNTWHGLLASAVPGAENKSPPSHLSYKKRYKNTSQV